jgi:hypothetical protein
MKMRCSGVLLIGVLGFVAGRADAQRGVVFGTLVDAAGHPCEQRAFSLPGLTALFVSDDQGRYRVEVPPGRYNIPVLALSGEPTYQEILVPLGGNVMADVLAGGVGNVPHADNIEKIRPHDNRDAVPIDSIRVLYHEQNPPVKHGPLELTVGYRLAAFSDSLRVEVTIRGENVSKKTTAVCGCLSFWDASFGLGPECWGDVPLGHVQGWMDTRPKPSVHRAGCETPVFEGDMINLAPGKYVSRTMMFSFRPEEFREKTGEVLIQCYYFTGKSGQKWEDVERVDLGVIAVPIRPPGMPARYKS